MKMITWISYLGTEPLVGLKHKCQPPSLHFEASRGGKKFF